MKPLKIGIQGGKGSFNEEAFYQYLKTFPIVDYHIDYLYTSPQVVQALLQGKIDRGQCAISNSLGGEVTETIQALENASVSIIESFEMKIVHTLMIRPDQDFNKIDTVMCHPQVLAQCKNTLNRLYPHFKQTSGEGEWIDNAKTAEALSTGLISDNTAIIGSKTLAKIYNLKVIADQIQDSAENYTRFIHIIKH